MRQNTHRLILFLRHHFNFTCVNILFWDSSADRIFNGIKFCKVKSIHKIITLRPIIFPIEFISRLFFGRFKIKLFKHGSEKFHFVFNIAFFQLLLSYQIHFGHDLSCWLLWARLIPRFYISRLRSKLRVNIYNFWSEDFFNAYSCRWIEFFYVTFKAQNNFSGLW